MDSEYSKKDLARGVDYIGVNCVFFCHDGAGKFLFHKRSTKCRDEHGTWDCGAGAMEFGETFDDAVRREVQEEYGAESKGIQYVGTANVLRENTGIPTHWIKNIHLVEVDPDTVRVTEPEKVDELGWFALDDLPQPLHSQIAHDVSMIREFLEKNI